MHLSPRSAALALAVALAACAERSPPAATKASESTGAKAPRPGVAPAPPVPPAAALERVIAIGDIHGDLRAARRALRTAGAIDERDAWVGGKLVVVQTGDQIDRGKEDREVL
ncbi:MAG TPA: calcineurin, partial [Polyangiaceae bacterium]|nr:calcineurin [Polyangiaceae bacterium]